MEDDRISAPEKPARRPPWNKGKLVGAKPPLRPSHVWSIRTKLQMQSLTRDLALFNLAIDSKLRGCDVVAVRVDDIAPSGYALDLATVRQKKTGKVSAVRADGANAAGHRVSEANRLEAGELPVSWSTRCVAGHDHPSTPGLFESWGEHRT